MKEKVEVILGSPIWTPAGAHRLLQVPTRVLDHQLDNDIARWHPTQPIAA